MAGKRARRATPDFLLMVLPHHESNGGDTVRRNDAVPSLAGRASLVCMRWLTQPGKGPHQFTTVRTSHASINAATKQFVQQHAARSTELYAPYPALFWPG